MTTEQQPSETRSKFAGRKASPCSKCKSVRFYENRLGGLSCLACRPPVESDFGAIILEIASGIWKQADLQLGQVDEWQPEIAPDFVSRDYGGTELEQKTEPEIFDWDAAKRPEKNPLANLPPVGKFPLEQGPPRFWPGALVTRVLPVPAFGGPVAGPFVVLDSRPDGYGREVLNLAISGREVLTGVSSVGFEVWDFGF